MNAAQVHLALNHVPIALVLIGVPLLAIALLRKSGELKSAAAALFVLATLATLPVYFSGEPAEEIVEHRPGVSEAVIHDHEEAAELSLVLVGILGVATLASWLVERSKKAMPPVVWVGVLVLGLVDLGAFVRTAHLGGLIRHDELGAATSSASESRAAAGHSERGEHDEDDD